MSRYITWRNLDKFGEVFFWFHAYWHTRVRERGSPDLIHFHVTETHVKRVGEQRRLGRSVEVLVNSVVSILSTVLFRSFHHLKQQLPFF